MLTSLLSIFSGLLFLLISSTIGGGWCPIFSIFSLKKSRYFQYTLIFFLLSKVLYDFSVGLLGFTFIVYISYLLSYLSVIKVKKSGMSLFISATMFYFVSNSLCFVQTITVFSTWAMYTADLTGYLICMAAGIPYYLRSLLSSFGLYYLCAGLSHIEFRGQSCLA